MKIRISRDNMAFVYAGLIPIKGYPFDKLNRIIINRWSLSGLTYVKERAWKVLEELEKLEVKE